MLPPTSPARATILPPWPNRNWHRKYPPNFQIKQLLSRQPTIVSTLQLLEFYITGEQEFLFRSLDIEI